MSSEAYLTAKTKPLASSVFWFLGSIFENMGNSDAVIG
jgi:hypothetical protein